MGLFEFEEKNGRLPNVGDDAEAAQVGGPVRLPACRIMCP
jgi:hypothetical protein